MNAGYILQDSGLLTHNYSENQYTLDIAIKEFKHPEILKKSIKPCRKITYDQANGVLIIRIFNNYYYNIILNEEQRIKYENGISDPNLDKIRKLEKYARKIQLIDNKKEIEARATAAVKRGELPNTIQEVQLYSKCLDNELLKDKAAIASRSFKTIWPFLLIGLSAPAFPYVTSNDYIIALAGLAVLDSGAFITGLVNIFKCKQKYKDKLKELIQETRILSLRKVDLKEHEQRIRASKSSKTTDGATLKEDEEIKLISLDANTLKLIKQIFYLLKRLPEKEQKKYVETVDNLIKIHRSRLLGVELDNTLYANNNALDTNFDLKSELESIHNRLETRAKEELLSSLINEDCNSLITIADKIIESSNQEENEKKVQLRH